MTPIDDYLQTKEAAPAWVKEVGRGAMDVAKPRQTGQFLAQLGLVAGGVGLAAAARQAYHAITKRSDFDAMMGANPDLKEFQRENPKQFTQHYNSFRRMNPQFASEPTVAGTYMRQMSLNPESAGKTIVESIGGQAPDPMGMRDISTGVEMAERMAPRYKQMTEAEAAAAPMKAQQLQMQTAHLPLQIQRTQQQIAMDPLQTQRLQQQIAEGSTGRRAPTMQTARRTRTGRPHGV
jgi:hypothetical protein